MEKVAIIARLRELNPNEDLGPLTMYADLFEEYRQAQAHIDEHGAICWHPKTGAPIQNPYLAIRDSAMVRLVKAGIETGELWKR